MRNKRIAAMSFLNQRCAFASDLESMLLTQVSKIVLQHIPPESCPYQKLDSTISVVQATQNGDCLDDPWRSIRLVKGASLLSAR
jgi:hypothetical protein